MTYKIKLHPEVHKFIEKLDQNIAERIRKRLKLLENEPFRYLEHYESQTFFKFRIGEYRALIDVDTMRFTIFIRVLDHRSKIYKRN
ncbi:type II toxin-antitoxin system RelE/ParE family toxin [Candidatus Woesearchaeota archaeon]|nr:type II toxin-antitoxin system RelE/ParE family toxin [Candidatus Woesearchaeota archaeon]